MTKVRFVGPIGGFSGAMDEMVFADHGTHTVAYMKKKKKGELSEAELLRDERWKAARAYAKSAMADPVKWEIYKTVGKEKNCPAFALAVGDYLNTPTLNPLDLDGYKGRVGNPIRIRALDDVGLASVAVSIEQADGTGIEQGMAVEMGPHTGFWVYTATQPVAYGSNIFIEVVGVDYAGHRVKLTENPIVGTEE